MSLLQVFFWFCKEQRIMDIIIQMYNLKEMGYWKYENNCPFFERCSLREFLERKVILQGFEDLFWAIQPINAVHLTNNNRYKKARAKWNTFVKNNLKFSDDFIKVGDKVKIDTDNPIEGVVTNIPKNFDGIVHIRTDSSRELPIRIIELSDYSTINGVEKKPKYCIKRRREIYGLDEK